MKKFFRIGIWLFFVSVAVLNPCRLRFWCRPLKPVVKESPARAIRRFELEELFCPILMSAIHKKSREFEAVLMDARRISFKGVTDAMHLYLDEYFFKNTWSLMGAQRETGFLNKDAILAAFRLEDVGFCNIYEYFVCSAGEQRAAFKKRIITILLDNEEAEALADKAD
jgi:hypothetical protein